MKSVVLKALYKNTEFFFQNQKSAYSVFQPYRMYFQTFWGKQKNRSDAIKFMELLVKFTVQRNATENRL